MNNDDRAKFEALTDERILMIGRRALDKCHGADAQHIYLAREVERVLAAAQAARPEPVAPGWVAIAAADTPWPMLRQFNNENELRAFLALYTPPPAASAELRNQCDGCQAGMPMRGDLHTDSSGRAVMACQKNRYTTPAPAVAPAAVTDAELDRAVSTLERAGWRSDDSVNAFAAVEALLAPRQDCGGAGSRKAQAAREDADARRRWLRDTPGSMPVYVREPLAASPTPDEQRAQAAQEDVEATVERLMRDEVARVVDVERRHCIGRAVTFDVREAKNALREAIRTALAGRPQDAVTQAARDVLAERRRQVEAEGWTPEHDDEHDGGQLAAAGAAYAAMAAGFGYLKSRELFPWCDNWWKPSDDRRNLVKAGALILAEIERLDRTALAGRQQL